MKDVEIGQFVYRCGRPLRAGIVRELVASNKYFDDVRVQWIDGTFEVITTAWLKDFGRLIEDHQRKLATHTKTLAKLVKL